MSEEHRYVGGKAPDPSEGEGASYEPPRLALIGTVGELTQGVAIEVGTDPGTASLGV